MKSVSKIYIKNNNITIHILKQYEKKLAGKRETKIKFNIESLIKDMC